MSDSTRQRLLTLLRLAVSVGLLAWLIASADLRELWSALQSFNVAVYALVVPVSTFGMLLRAWRWHVVLHAAGARISFKRAVYLCYIGAFFNTILPSGIGGDVVRVLEVGPGVTKQQATGTVLIDRLAGFVVLFLFALLALPASARYLPPATVWLIALMGLGVLAAAVVLVEGKFMRAIIARLPLPRALSLAGDTWLGQTYDVIARCGLRALGQASLIAVLFNLVAVLFTSWLVAQSLNLAVPLWALAAFIPVMTASLLLPISISGFGVREGVAVALFTQIGLTAPQAVLLSLGWYAQDMMDGLIGGVIYLAVSALGLRRPATPGVENSGLKTWKPGEPG
ncbi:MAG: lysylphosphatidylglycerol synthase transmembrane domain-containing protein [Anaerolineales bacterium]